MTKTQSDCRQEFYAACRRFIDELQAIDKETPWSEREPKWWLAMQTLESQTRDAARVAEVSS